MAKRTNQPSQKAPYRDLPWQEAIKRVLSSADGALHYTEIADRIILQDLRRAVGATPASTVNANLGVSLRDPNSPFIRVRMGEYTLKPNFAKTSDALGPKQKEPDEDTGSGALQAFGMFWRREVVAWNRATKLSGRQSPTATEVNFAEQVGVYLLHDRERVIYIGRAEDKLLVRLRAHTTDRLSGRWDRFSWFGLRKVKDDGSLADVSVNWSQDIVIQTLEAILIESLEPPLNRRRGDNLASLEYQQIVDPEVQNRRILAQVESALKNGAGVND